MFQLATLGKKFPQNILPRFARHGCSNYRPRLGPGYRYILRKLFSSFLVPKEPTNLTAENPTARSITLSWLKPWLYTGPTDYNISIYRGNDTSQSPEKAITIEGTCELSLPKMLVFSTSCYYLICK